MSSFTRFSDLPITPALTTALEKMQFVTPTPIQAAALPPALEGKDVLGSAQTGTGKTAAFGIPLLNSLYGKPGEQALILAPTRELAAQIHKVLHRMGGAMKMKGTLIVGGESFYRQTQEIKGGVDYFIATPGRLVDHLQQSTIRLDKVRILVLDEVDRMMDMGFAPQIKEILRRVPRTRQTLLFSATLPRDIEKLAHQMLNQPVRVAIGKSEQPVSTIKQDLVQTTHDAKPQLLLEKLGEREGRILVFARTKFRTEKLVKFLSREGQPSAALHGGRTQGQRREALAAFRNGKVRVLVATDLAGRGLDVEDVNHVINYDLPATRDEYIHRIGRTGRCGKEGSALNFVTSHDKDFRELLGLKGHKQPTPSPRARAHQRGIRFQTSNAERREQQDARPKRPFRNGPPKGRTGRPFFGGKPKRRFSGASRPA